MIKTENQNAFDRGVAGRDVRLDLTVTDRETVVELLKYDEESAREDYALSVLQ